MEDIIQQIANAFGVQTGAVQGSIIALLMYALLHVLRLLVKSREHDVQQTTLEQTLAVLASNAVNESSALRLAYENNTTALNNIRDAFSTMGDSFVEQIKAVVSELTDVKDELKAHSENVTEAVKSVKAGFLGGSVTRVSIRDSKDTEIFAFKATPKKENNEDVLVITIQE